MQLLLSVFVCVCVCVYVPAGVIAYLPVCMCRSLRTKVVRLCPCVRVFICLSVYVTVRMFICKQVNQY